MALWFPLKVNNETIGLFSAQRIVTGANGLNTYKVGIYDGDIISKPETLLAEFEVQHHYHHGAWVLVGRALDEFGAVPRVTGLSQKGDSHD